MPRPRDRQSLGNATAVNPSFNRKRVPTAGWSACAFRLNGVNSQRNACGPICGWGSGVSRAAPGGFTLIELLVAIAIIGILLALILPAVQNAREAARSSECKNSLRQLAIATENYVAAHTAFPLGRVWEAGATVGTATEWSQHARLLPYLDQGNLYAKIDFTRRPDDTSSPGNNAVRRTRLSLFRCPSDPADYGETRFGDNGWNNYRANGGSYVGILSDRTWIEHNNGIFVTNSTVRKEDIRDGASHTALFSEAVLGDGNDGLVKLGDVFGIPSGSSAQNVRGTMNLTTDDVDSACRHLSPAPTGSGNQTSWPGRSWVFGGYLSTRYTHILPPNGNSCGRSWGDQPLDPGANNGGGAFTASSRHRGGAHMGRTDGSVEFVNESIDSKVWRAYGSRAGNDPR